MTTTKPKPMSHDTPDDDESTNRPGNGLSIDDLTAGMRITDGSATFDVVRTPHVESGLAVARIAEDRGVIGQHSEKMSVESDKVRRMLRDKEFHELQTYNATKRDTYDTETHVAVSRVDAARAADEVDWIIQQFEQAYLSDPTREELLETRNRIYDALGYDPEGVADDYRTEDHE